MTDGSPSQTMGHFMILVLQNVMDDKTDEGFSMNYEKHGFYLEKALLHIP